MSFSFRNIFSPGESGYEETPDGAFPGGFGAPGEVPPGRGNLEGPGTPVLAQGAYQTFFAGELLAFIPPAISARSGIPMEREIHVPVPASGSLEVKLSTLYEICPELFATEITPLNDSTVPLPPRLGATPMTPATAPAASAKGLSGGDPKPGAGNPFWSPPGAAAPLPSAPATPNFPAAAASVVGNPFSAPSAPGAADGGVWGEMFAGASADTEDAVEDRSDAEAMVEEPESIRKLIKEGGGIAGFDAPATLSAPAPATSGEPMALSAAGPDLAPAPASAFSADPFAAWESAKPSRSAEPAVAEAEAPGEEAEVAEDAPVVQQSSRGAEPSAASADERDLELRAVFSTGERFTLSKVARRVVGLPGIRSCSLSTPAKTVHASRGEENRLGNEAREMVATLRNLAKLTGLPDARTFTLQTDRGIVSLFLEGHYCVTVHHESADFGPGVREKLILVARSLSKLDE